MDKQWLEWAIEPDKRPVEFRTHVGTVEGARRTAVAAAKKEFAGKLNGGGPRIVIRRAVTKQIVEDFRL